MRWHIGDKAAGKVTLHATHHVVIFSILSFANGDRCLSLMTEKLLKSLPDCPKSVVLKDGSTRDTAQQPLL